MSYVRRLANELERGSATAPLSELLPKLVILAKRLGRNEIARWAQLESGGYFATNAAMGDDITLPEYRGVPGTWRDEVGRPLVIRDPTIAFVNTYRLRHSIGELEELRNAEPELVVQDPSFPELIKGHLHVDVSQFSFHPREVRGVLSAVRGRLIEYVEEIIKEVPAAPGKGKEIPYWEFAGVLAVVSMILAALVIYWPTSRVTWILLVGVVVFVGVMWLHPASWYRRMAASTLGVAGIAGAVPSISGMLNIPEEGAGWFIVNNAPHTAIPLIILSAVFAWLDYKSRQA